MHELLYVHAANSCMQEHIRMKISFETSNVLKMLSGGYLPLPYSHWRSDCCCQECLSTKRNEIVTEIQHWTKNNLCEYDNLVNLLWQVGHLLPLNANLVRVMSKSEITCMTKQNTYKKYSTNTVNTVDMQHHIPAQCWSQPSPWTAESPAPSEGPS